MRLKKTRDAKSPDDADHAFKVESQPVFKAQAVNLVFGSLDKSERGMCSAHCAQNSFLEKVLKNLTRTYICLHK